MYKRVFDLTYDEAKEVLNHNRDIEEKVFDWALNSVGYWLDDYLRAFPRNSVDYEIGYGSRGYFTVKDFNAVENALEDLQQDFEFLTEDNYKEALSLIQQLNDLEDMESWSDDDEKQYHQLSSKLNSIIYNRLQLEYDSVDNYLEEYLVEYPDTWFTEEDFVDTDTWEVFNIEDRPDVYSDGSYQLKMDLENKRTKGGLIKIEENRNVVLDDKNKDVLKQIYYNLNNGGSYGEYIETQPHMDEKYLFWDVLKFHNRFIWYRHFGSSVIEKTIDNLAWVITNIFDMTPVEFENKYELWDKNDPRNEELNV